MCDSLQRPQTHQRVPYRKRRALHRHASRSSSAAASLSVSARPIIRFGIFFAVFASSAWASTNEPPKPSIDRVQAREDQRAALLNAHDARAVDLMDEPEQRAFTLPVCEANPISFATN